MLGVIMRLETGIEFARSQTSQTSPSCESHIFLEDPFSFKI